MHGDGSSERDYTYIRDCVDGVLAAVEWTARPRPGGGLAEPINIGGGARGRLHNLIKLIGRTLARGAPHDPHGDQPRALPPPAPALPAAPPDPRTTPPLSPINT